MVLLVSRNKLFFDTPFTEMGQTLNKPKKGTAQHNTAQTLLRFVWFTELTFFFLPTEAVSCEKKANLLHNIQLFFYILFSTTVFFFVVYHLLMSIRLLMQ